MQFNLPFQTTEEYKNFVLQSKSQEQNCPCCGRLSKVYRRKINAGIAVQLIEFYNQGGAVNFLHVSKLKRRFLTVVGDFTKAKYWGLIYPDGNEDPAKKTSGRWRITAKGVAFIKGEVALQKYSLTLFDQLLGFEGDMVMIQDCLATKGFNYADLMAGV